MLSVKECRKKLGKKYEHLTDEEIEQIRNFLIELAEINVEIIKNAMKKEKERGIIDPFRCASGRCTRR